jgi:predicted DNA-binding transcriptional regulator AlpA
VIFAKRVWGLIILFHQDPSIQEEVDFSCPTYNILFKEGCSMKGSLTTNETLNEDMRGVTFLQVSDIQKMMGISRASAYALVKRNGFPKITVGNRIIIPCNLFNEWVVKTAKTRRC